MKKLSIWLTATFFSFFQFFLQTASGVIGVEWMRDFHLNKVELGSLSSAFFYTYALMQIPVGILFDRFSPRYLLGVAALLLTTGCWWLAYTDNYTMAFMARLLMGFGSSFAFIGMLQINATFFSPKRFAVLVGLSEGVAMLSVSSSILFLTWLVSNYSWRIALLASGMITLLLAVAFFILLRDDKQRPVAMLPWSMASILSSLKTIFTHKQVMLCSFYGFFMFAIVNAFTSLWGIPFLISTYAMDELLAAKLIGMIFIGIAMGSPLSGWLAKLLEQNRILLIIAAMVSTLTVGSIILIPHLHLTWLYMLFLLAGLSCAAYVQCFTVIKDSVDSGMCATALASANMIIMLGAPILQLTIAYLLQHHVFGLATDISQAYRYALCILPIGMLIAILLAINIQESPHLSSH